MNLQCATATVTSALSLNGHGPLIQPNGHGPLIQPNNADYHGPPNRNTTNTRKGQQHKCKHDNWHLHKHNNWSLEPLA